MYNLDKMARKSLTPTPEKRRQGHQNLEGQEVLRENQNYFMRLNNNSNIYVRPKRMYSSDIERRKLCSAGESYYNKKGDIDLQ